MNKHHAVWSERKPKYKNETQIILFPYYSMVTTLLPSTFLSFLEACVQVIN